MECQTCHRCTYLVEVHLLRTGVIVFVVEEKIPKRSWRPPPPRCSQTPSHRCVRFVYKSSIGSKVTLSSCTSYGKNNDQTVSRIVQYICSLPLVRWHIYDDRRSSSSSLEWGINSASSSWKKSHSTVKYKCHQVGCFHLNGISISSRTRWLTLWIRWERRRRRGPIPEF